MSRYVEGKEIARAEWMDGPSGNPAFWEKGRPWCKDQTMIFHMQDFGDHGLGWLLTLGKDGVEIERRPAKSVDRIVWLKPEETAPAMGDAHE